MGINRKLNDIILKYQLDRGYPRFRKKLLGEEKLVIWADKVKEDRILCVGTDQEDINYFSHFFFTCGKEFTYCLFSKIKKEEAEKYARIVVISKELDDERIRWCMQCGKPVTFLYDYLERQGIYCEDEIHKVIGTDYNSRLLDNFPARKGWREVVLLEFYVNRKKLVMAEDSWYQMHCARKLFFLSLYIRNFVQAEKYQKLLADAGDLSATKAWTEIQALLTEIRDRLRDRRQADIVMVWMDAVSYGTGRDMPYLQKQIANGISFENAFTVTPRTNPTAQTLFLGKKLIDDKLYLKKEIREEESPVLLDLKNHGYDCKIISGYLSIFGRKRQSANYHNLYAPCSEIFWDMLYHLLSSDKPIFLVMHALTEGHAPYLSARMKENFFDEYSRVHQGHLELDEQMEYYMEFLNRRASRIFMSDHGQLMVREQFHTYFVVVGERFCCREAKELFSYVDFPKLLHEILEGSTLKQPLFEREYVEVQMLDWYNYQIIKDIIQKKKPLLLAEFGYFGVITREHLYLKYHIGKEFLALRSHMDREPHFLYQAHDICDASLLPYFRGIIGTRILDISEGEKFQYTRYLYQIYENFIQERNNVFAIVNRLFEKYPDSSVALRTGGEHSLELFYVLTKENQRKLAYILDDNLDCKCRRLDLPVISIQDMEGKGIRAVVLSSFDHLVELRQEIPDYPKAIDIIDIYKSLEASGIRCRSNFYVEDSYIKDDVYDVGFPFDKED